MPSSSFLPLLFLLLLFAFTSSSSSPLPSPWCPSSDFKALLEIKQSLGNPSILASWSRAAANCCAWDHLQCDPTGRVNNVFIDSADEVCGTIPPAIARLTSLIAFSLFRLPHLAGPVPPFLSSLPNLRFLTISHTAVSGAIPGNDLARLHLLDSIDLSSNNLSGPIPRVLSTLPNLRFLDLKHNRLTGTIPPALVHGRFAFLILSHNQLTGEIPREYADGDINTIDFSHNQLTGDASFLFAAGRPTGLVDLSWNALEFDLGCVVLPRELTYLNLSHNRIRGTLPASLAGLTQLRTLDLSYNQLCGKIPRERMVVRHGPKAFAHNKCLCGAPLPACRH